MAMAAIIKTYKQGMAMFLLMYYWSPSGNQLTASQRKSNVVNKLQMRYLINLFDTVAMSVTTRRQLKLEPKRNVASQAGNAVPLTSKISFSSFA